MTTHYDSAIVGFGKTGASCARYLADKGEHLLIVDDCGTPKNHADLATLPADQLTTRFGHFEPEELAGTISQAARLIFSPGVDRRRVPFNAPVLDSLPVTCDIELFTQSRRERAQPGVFIAITGSNGKSTVTDLTSRLLASNECKVATGGNFGTAALDLLQQQDVDCWVLELSSFQLELTASLAAEVALILNITEDHLDRHGTFDRYAHCKQRIFNEASLCIWNRADPATSPSTSCEQISVGLDAPPGESDFGIITTQTEGRCLAAGSHWRFPVRDLRLSGEHNEINALFALAAAWRAGGQPHLFASVLRDYEGLPHRCQTLACARGVTFVDDSKATNVDAARAALQALSTPGKRNLLLLAGGQGKSSDFLPLAVAASQCVRQAALFGSDADELAQAFSGHGVSYIKTEHLSEAFNALTLQAVPGDVLLLSPACASQDQFRDFQERGLAFKALVDAWLSAEGGGQ